jgi:hypothetical protein
VEGPALHAHGTEQHAAERSRDAEGQIGAVQSRLGDEPLPLVEAATGLGDVRAASPSCSRLQSSELVLEIGSHSARIKVRLERCFCSH